MKTSKKQRNFAKAFSYLTIFLYSMGYEFTYSNAYMKQGSNDGRKDNSTHRIRLAIDINLWIDDEYVTSGDHPAWAELHNYWDKLGGSKRIKRDMNHFSYKHNGVR